MRSSQAKVLQLQQTLQTLWLLNKGCHPQGKSKHFWNLKKILISIFTFSRSPSNLSPRDLNISEELSTPPGVNGASGDSAGHQSVDVRLLGSRSYEFIDVSSCFLYPQLDVTTRIQARQQIVLLQVKSLSNLPLLSFTFKPETNLEGRCEKVEDLLQRKIWWVVRTERRLHEQNQWLEGHLEERSQRARPHRRWRVC